MAELEIDRDETNNWKKWRRMKGMSNYIFIDMGVILVYYHYFLFMYNTFYLDLIICLCYFYYLFSLYFVSVFF